VDSDGIVITGMGIVSAAGTGLAAAKDALLANRDGLGPLTLFASERCGHFPVAETKGVVVPPGGYRVAALGAPALRDALAMAGLGEAPRRLRDATALVVGTTVGGMPETERGVAELLAGTSADHAIWIRNECALTSALLADEAKLGGPVLTVSNACASGAQAIATGIELLRAGEAELVVAGGVDALCRFTLNGFASLLAIDPAGCRPFDAARRGMSLGEGAAFVVLECARSAAARGARVRAVYLGSGNTCDAYHATAPDPQGRGGAAAMRAALAEARIVPEAIDYVNAHGTGTPENDRAEGAALLEVFGARMPAVSSTKRVFGHALAAAGAIEAVACILALEEGFLPGTCGLATPDPECRVQPLLAPRRAKPRIVLSNSFGFGGNNTVLCLGHAELAQ
jgi:3-oxoacyl-[acyl-carrier-protein] synthase II